MTLLGIIIAALVAASQAAGSLFRLKERDLLEAEKIWPRVHARLVSIIDADAFPDSIAENVTVFSAIAGCGCFTRQMLLTWAMKKIGLKRAQDRPVPEIQRLSEHQRHELGLLLRDLILLDSYYVWFSGRLLRTLKHHELTKEAVRPRAAETKGVRRMMVSASAVASRPSSIDRLPAALKARVPQAALCQ